MYQVLARKYRPRNFNELVGQNHVSRALTSALERGRLHHAYLFTGTRGVGKTTIARILAKCLNCETGITSTPCEVCTTCRAINEGRFIDLIEIDAASRTKVEDTRELLDNVPYAPTQGRFKVYLIDEVHMLSTHSFNALLKTLEEPPEHVKFLFATTDPQKLPITVISRCLQFTLRPLAVDEITQHLGEILQKEHIQADQDAIWQIAESAQGSLRDALSLTDQAIAYGQGAIHHQDVKEMLGLIDRTIIYDLILAIHQNQQRRVSELLLQFRQQALDVSLVLDQLISTLHELALLQYLPDLGLKYSAEINQKILQLSKLISAQDLQLYYQIACKGRGDLQIAVTQEQGFEMCVLRLLAFRPLDPTEYIEVESTITVESSSSVMPQSMNSIESIESGSNRSEIHFAEKKIEEHRLSEQIIATHQPVQSLETSVTEQINVSHDTVIFDAEHHTLTGFDIVENSSKAPENETLHWDPIIPETTAHLEKNHPIEHEVDAIQEIDLFTVQANKTHEDIQDVDEMQFVSHGMEQAHSLETDERPRHASPDVVTQLGLESQEEKFEPLLTQDTVTEAQSSGHEIVLMPQDILKLSEQSLDGEWTLEKWEYWFRTSALSPAVQELAQYGLMTGMINGVSQLSIPKEYEGMLSQLQHALESSLKAQWPNTQFSVIYHEIEGATPFILQSQRKEKAFHCAAELLKNDSTIKSLIETFDAQLVNIQLKNEASN